MQRIFFDNNATTKIDRLVLQKMNEVYEFGLNSSSVHYYGRLANGYVEEAREAVKHLFNAGNYRVIFTSSGTEANNMAINGAVSGAFEKIFMAKIEHDSVFKVRPENSEIIFIKTDENGVISVDDLKEKLEEVKTSNFLVSIMLANNETGAIQPVKEIAKLVHQKGGLIHSDTVQATGKIVIDLEDLNVDFASVSAHKIKGPQGVGALILRKNLDVKPIIYGGGHEGGARSGTLNCAGIAGFGLACTLIKERLQEFAKIVQLRDFLEKEIAKIAGDKVIFFSQNAERLANTSFMATKGLNNQMQLISFDLNGIMVSTGAACSSGTTRGSRVLAAMNMKEDLISSAVRISLGLENTKEEVEQFISVWHKLLMTN